jgi:hypothetical protein
MFEQQSEFKIEMEIAVRHVTMPSLDRFLLARDGAEASAARAPTPCYDISPPPLIQCSRIIHIPRTRLLGTA